MQFKFILSLGGHGHHAGIVRPWANLGKPDLITLYKQLNAKNSKTTQIVCNCHGNLSSPLKCGLRHRLRLPRLNIVTINLNMANRGAEVGLNISICP